MSNSETNKRIFKNTILLYFRMAVTMAVTLYTSRVILNVLGVEDYGIYNIVGGLVVLFSFLNSALTQATQRFLTFELGKKDFDKFNEIFNMSVILYLFLSVIIIFLAETVGLWFLNNKLNISNDRMYAANWVYQFSLLAFVLNLLKTPFNAVIVAYEKMSFYAYTSIFEVVFKLVIVFLLTAVFVDKLILYSGLVAVVSATLLFAFLLYCVNNFSTCKFKYYWDRQLLFRIGQFSGWTLFGSLSVMFANQGVNVILNMFFGVTVNAAVGVANQLCGAVQKFVSNFQMAFNPQVTKSFANNETKYLDSLVFRTSKLSFCLIFILAIPFLFKTQGIMTLWLGQVPEYAVVFCKLILISMIIEAFSGPLWMIIQASGNIRNYQIWMSGIKWIEFLGAIVLFNLGYNPFYAYVMRCIVSIISLIARLLILKKQLKFKSYRFVKEVLFRGFFIALTVVVSMKYISQLFFNSNSIISIIGLSVVSFVLNVLVIALLGLTKSEREYVLSVLTKKNK